MSGPLNARASPFLIVLAVAFSAASAHAQPCYLAGFTPVQQEATNWCWAACGEMAMDAVEATVASQCQQAELMLDGGVTCCPSSSTCNVTAAVTSTWPSYWQANMEGQGVSGALAYSSDGSSLKGEICQGRPVIFTWRECGGGYHMMLAYGVDDGWVTYVDPSDGDSWMVSYAKFVRGQSCSADGQYVYLGQGVTYYGIDDQ